MMWEFWVITGKLKVVFPLGNFGVTEGLQIVYWAVGKNISRSRRNSSSSVVVDVFSTNVL